MLITSAVPVFADTVGGWNPPEAEKPATETNAIMVTYPETLVSKEMAGSVSNGITFDTIVDLNRLSGGGVLELGFTDAQGNNPQTVSAAMGPTQIAIAPAGAVTNLSGICTLTWTIDKDGVKVSVKQMGKQEKPVGEIKLALNTTSTEFTGITMKGEAEGSSFVMYEKYPEQVEDVVVIKKNPDFDKTKAVSETNPENVEVTQPVA